jgi:hypothetical protein
LYELEVPYLTGDYRVGQEIAWQATFRNTGEANIRINSGQIVPLVTSTGNALSTGIVQQNAIIKAIFTESGSFNILNVSSVGSLAVDQGADYVWTGTHDYSAATVVGFGIDVTAPYDWENQHTYTQPPTVDVNGTQEPVLTASTVSSGVTEIRSISDNYTLALADANAVITTSAAGPITVTVPTNASVAFEVGTTVSINQFAAGQVTLAPAGGVSLYVESNLGLRTADQFSFATLLKIAPDGWLVTGSLTA